MKYILLFLTLFIGTVTTTNAQDQEPQTVHSVVKVFKDYNWYQQQYNLWQKEFKKDKKNTEAWTNAYAAARMAKIVAPDETEKEAWRKNMLEVMTKMEKAIPGTYTYYYLKAWDNSLWTAKNEKEEQTIANYAITAYNMDPSRPEVYPDLMNYYAIKDNPSKLQEIAQKWIQSNDMSPNTLAINYNMLMSTSSNAILITAGDNDTYPAMMLQYGKDIRTDVTLINIYLASFSAEYRNNLFKKAQIPELSGDNIEQKVIIDHILEHCGDHPLYFAFGNYFKDNPELEDNLYNVGLAMHYCETDFNNISALVHNFEQRLLLDHLTLSFHQEDFPEQVKRHNIWYLPGLMSLYEHYKVMENDKRKQAVSDLILDLVANTPHEKSVKASLGI